MLNLNKQMTDQEKAAVLRALPGPEDTIETARLKLRNYRTVYENTKERKIRSYMGEISSPLGKDKPKDKPLSKVNKPKTGDPLGLGL